MAAHLSKREARELLGAPDSHSALLLRKTLLCNTIILHAILLLSILNHADLLPLRLVMCNFYRSPCNRHLRLRCDLVQQHCPSLPCMRAHFPAQAQIRARILPLTPSLTRSLTPSSAVIISTIAGERLNALRQTGFSPNDCIDTYINIAT